jgi:hypothetical protein
MFHSNMKWRRAFTAAGFLGAAGIVAVVMTTGASAGSSGGGSTQSSVISDVLAKIGNSNLQSANVSNGTLSIVARPTDGLTTIWFAKLAASAIAHGLGDAKLTEPAQAQYVTPTGAPLGDAGADSVKPLVGNAPPLTSCGDAVSGSAADAGMKIVAAETVDVLGGACILTLMPTASASSTFAANSGALIGQTLAPVVADHARAYLVTVLDANDSSEEVIGWVPGIGGDYGQGMMWNGTGTGDSSSSGSTGP